jgi:hypothetical protein
MTKKRNIYVWVERPSAAVIVHKNISSFLDFEGRLTVEYNFYKEAHGALISMTKQFIPLAPISDMKLDTKIKMPIA